MRTSSGHSSSRALSCGNLPFLAQAKKGGRAQGDGSDRGRACRPSSARNRPDVCRRAGRGIPSFDRLLPEEEFRQIALLKLEGKETVEIAAQSRPQRTARAATVEGHLRPVAREAAAMNPATSDALDGAQWRASMRSAAASRKPGGAGSDRNLAKYLDDVSGPARVRPVPRTAGAGAGLPPSARRAPPLAEYEGRWSEFAALDRRCVPRPPPADRRGARKGTHETARTAASRTPSTGRPA